MNIDVQLQLQDVNMSMIQRAHAWATTLNIRLCAQPAMLQSQPLYCPYGKFEISSLRANGLDNFHFLNLFPGVSQWT